MINTRFEHPPVVKRMPVYDADLPDHPKLRQLEQTTGRSYAVLYLLRLWAYCATKARGENLGQMSSQTLERICRWDGEPGELYRALKEPCDGKSGWIKEYKKRQKIYVHVHDWEKYHSQIAASRRNGKRGGRPAKKFPDASKKFPDASKKFPDASKKFPDASTSNTNHSGSVSSKEPIGSGSRTYRASGTGTGTGTGTKSECVCEDARDAPAREADPGSHTPPAAGSGGVPDASDHTVGETRNPLAAEPGLFSLAKEILDELNRQLGSQFPVTEVTLRPIACRLCEIRSSIDDPVGEIKKMVRREVALYAGDVKRSSWLRPKTLFDERQFPNSFGARNLPVRSKKKNAAGLREAIEKHPANKESIYFRNDHTPEDKQQLTQLRAQLRELEQNDQQP